MKCFDRARSDYTKYPFEHRLHFRCHTFKQLIQSNKESTFWLPIQNKVQSESKTEILQEWFYLSYERVYSCKSGKNTCTETVKMAENECRWAWVRWAL